jgi:hypothetical protein
MTRRSNIAVHLLLRDIASGAGDHQRQRISAQESETVVQVT